MSCPGPGASTQRPRPSLPLTLPLPVSPSPLYPFLLTRSPPPLLHPLIHSVAFDPPEARHCFTLSRVTHTRTHILTLLTSFNLHLTLIFLSPFFSLFYLLTFVSGWQTLSPSIYVSPFILYFTRRYPFPFHSFSLVTTYPFSSSKSVSISISLFFSHSLILFLFFHYSFHLCLLYFLGRFSSPYVISSSISSLSSFPPVT